MAEQDPIDATPRLRMAPNFRDIGGLPAGEGRRIRAGCLYRSEALHELDERDLATLRGLDIGLICDLRTPHERERWPSRWPSGREPRRLQMEGLSDAGAADVRRVYERSRDDTEAQGRAYMMSTYRSFPNDFAATLAALLDHLIQGPGAAVVHCAAGKDRTGFICALVQHAVGVPRQHIEADYLLSDVHFGRERIAAILMQTSGFVPPSVDAFRVRKEYLDDLLGQVVDEYGSLDQYLERRAGLDPIRRERLRDRLLERLPA